MIFWNKHMMFHGDIKPANIVFFEQYSSDDSIKLIIKLIDFAGGYIRDLDP